MSLTDERTPFFSFRALLRTAPQLEPEDSILRFHQILRHLSLSALPIIEEGRLLGVISRQETLSILAIPSAEEREQALLQPVTSQMSPSPALAEATMSLEEIGRLCAAHQLDMIPVVDAQGCYLGYLNACDLLLPEAPPPPRPGLVGGMATPFGVYLTDGALQAGASNVALVTSGVFMGLLFALSLFLVEGALRIAGYFTHLSNSPLLHLGYEPPAEQPLMGFTAVGLNILVMLVFLLLMRTSRVAGYHAAEHQAVHALERGEPLVPTIVSRMPRPHPRCGTNIMAAGFLFYNISLALRYVPYVDASSAYMFAAVGTFFTWRRVGSLFQQQFTTRPANAREIESGIQAANSLIDKYLRMAPTRIRFLRRIWCMGLIQVIVGMMPTLYLTLRLMEIWKF